LAKKALKPRQPQVIGYIRVSTTEQATFGVSLESQSQQIKAWNDYHQRGSLLLVKDGGVSGKSLKNRPELRMALEMLERGDTFVVVALSRLARSVQDALDIANLLKKKGASLVSMSEDINTASPTGEFFFHLLASLAQLERRQIGERTSACLRHLFLNGGYIGGRRPFGFDLVNVAGKIRLILNKSEWLVIEEARRLRSDGLSFRGIAKKLKAMGHGRPSGEQFFPMQVARMMEPKPKGHLFPSEPVTTNRARAPSMPG
jgi:site-specific DNA recombinase